jgi:hypothetical protein
MKVSVFATLVLSSFAAALPSLKRRGGSFVLQNGIDAINLKYVTSSPLLTI